MSFAINEDGIDALGAANSLGARYVVDGAVYHSEDSLRISIELIDGKEGTLVWASSFDGAKTQIVEFRDQIVKEIASAVNQAISDEDLDRLQSTGTRNSLAFQEIILGRQAAASFTEERLLVAERHFRRATEIDATYARAYAELAAIYAIRFENGWVFLSAADEEKALYFANTAIELDPDLWLAHYALGRLYSAIDQKNFAKAEFHLERAMSLQPANDDARVYYGAVKVFQGQVEEALAIFEPVLASHPNPPFWYHLSLGHALFHDGQNEAAERSLNECLSQMTSSPYCLRFQIANYGQMGRLDDAEWTIEEYAILGFEPSIHAIMDLLLDDVEENKVRLKKGFRAAGLPD